MMTKRKNIVWPVFLNCRAEHIFNYECRIRDINARSFSKVLLHFAYALVVILFLHKDSLYLIGGAEGENRIGRGIRVDRMNLRNGRITPVTPMNRPRTNFTALVSGNSILIFGGIISHQSSSCTVSFCDEYDPTADRWVELVLQDWAFFQPAW